MSKSLVSHFIKRSLFFEVFPKKRGVSEFSYKKGDVGKIGGCSKKGVITNTNPF